MHTLLEWVQKYRDILTSSLWVACRPSRYLCSSTSDDDDDDDDEGAASILTISNRDALLATQVFITKRWIFLGEKKTSWGWNQRNSLFNTDHNRLSLQS